jgi:hypothetical protein
MPQHPRAKVRPDGTCTRCNQTHTRSACHTSKGQPCMRQPAKGQTICPLHGGSSPNAIRKAARVLAEQEAEQAAHRAIRTLGMRIDGLNISPTEALLEEVTWTYVHVQWLRVKVQELEEHPAVAGAPGPVTFDDDGNMTEHDDAHETLAGHALVWGQTEHKAKTGGDDWGTTTVHKAGPNVWYELYSRERDRLIKVCSEAIRAGIDERRVQLAEQQGALVAEAIRRILDDLGLTAEQTARVGEIVPRHLRAIAGGTS